MQNQMKSQENRICDVQGTHMICIMFYRFDAEDIDLTEEHRDKYEGQEIDEELQEHIQERVQGQTLESQPGTESIE